MISIQKFVPQIASNVPACPRSILVATLSSTLMDFCERSLLWTKMSVPTDIVAKVPRYTFVPEDEATVVSASLALCNDRALEQTTLDELNSTKPSWRSTKGEAPTVYFMDTSYSIRVYPEPTKDLDKALQVQVALKPKRDAKEVPDFLYENWADTIVHGTLAKLFAMTSKEWANPQLVAFHEEEYRAGLSRAKSKAIKSRQSVSISVKNRPFGVF